MTGTRGTLERGHMDRLGKFICCPADERAAAVDELLAVGLVMPRGNRPWMLDPNAFKTHDRTARP